MRQPLQSVENFVPAAFICSKIYSYYIVNISVNGIDKC